DDLINQASEECDGAADAACTGRCRVECTCAPAPPSPAPRCGDNAINQPSEQCARTDSARRPGACRADCTCPPPPPSPSGAPVGTVEADTLVNKASPAKNNGTSARLEVDASPAKHAFFRVRVSGVGARQVTPARRRLQVSNGPNSQAGPSRPILSWTRPVPPRTTGRAPGSRSTPARPSTRSSAAV